jgi:hypothetical protein
MVNTDKVVGGVILGILGILCFIAMLFIFSFACCVTGIIICIIGFVVFLLGLMEDNEPRTVVVYRQPPPPPSPQYPRGVQQSRYHCTQCGTVLRWVPEYGRWYCYRCRKYI